VIPKWVSSLLKGDTVSINGDGETSRDFTFIQNAIQANLLAATIGASEARQSVVHPALNQVYNMAVGDQTTLNQLFRIILANLSEAGVDQATAPSYLDFRAGDVRHSRADVSKARQLLGYQPTHNIVEGIAQSMSWYQAHLKHSI
jgi:UDP-N-acetylglucosamine 4-epimerase